MAKYTVFHEVVERDRELANYFLQEKLAICWINAIINVIAKWVSDKKDKSLWELVRYVSIRRGVINKNLSREKFAKLVFVFCREALEENETPSKIKSSMEHCRFISDLKYFDKLLDTHIVRGYITELEALFDGQIKASELESEPKEPSVADILEAYLRSIVKETEIFPCQKIRVNPDYGDGIIPTIAIEEYLNKSFLKLNKPSRIIAYECISGALDINRLRSFIGQYVERPNMKLFVVSTFGLSSDAYSLAEKKEIGYVCINPKKEMTDNNYVLPRSIEDKSINSRLFSILLGQVKMDIPLIVCDRHHIMSSLADMLKSHNIRINPQYELHAPYFRFEEIEEKADELTQDYVDNCKGYIRKSNGCLYVEEKNTVSKREKGHSYVDVIQSKRYVDLSVNPFVIAENQGLQYEVKKLPENQLGRLDLQKEIVTLNDLGYSNYERFRFTMAHELGHYMLHAPLIKQNGVVSFGDTDDTISDIITIADEEREWFERQANYFAACLLMPRKLVLILYTFLHFKFVSQKYGDPLSSLFYNPNQIETFDSYKNVVVGMAKILNVSITAMERRLTQLNLLLKGK